MPPCSVDLEGACDLRVRFDDAPTVAAESAEEERRIDAEQLWRNFMVRDDNPRALAARGLADAVVRAIEIGDNVVAEAAARALYDFVSTLRK